ncbi:replication initiation factor domain-containing protein [Xylella fastidiosa]|uniref:replication initiation factor domain-containing protein n=2 Tax=Xylella fastidiosa TaxID=2371 RepID=UPI0003D2F656|nr:replication initiation factor domain-containing protein [Xylella fastidiosa]ALR04612.1 replication initiation factor domain-containing protein [Xylella fastidiosa]KXB21401.1 Replication initiation factor [Xylella fastidiosa]OJZ70920.1 Replication initiation factor [Xylella fastidiosa 6c]
MGIHNMSCERAEAFPRPSGENVSYVDTDVGQGLGASRLSIGPSSNTGQKGEWDCLGMRQDDFDSSRLACVDFLTVVMSRDLLQQCGYLDESKFLLSLLFNLDPKYISIGKHTSNRWHFYSSSASIFDHNGDVVGKLGWDGNNDSFCISLSGAACRYIRDWSKVISVLQSVGARITRCDVAYDDYQGELGTVRHHEAQARENLAPSGGCLLFASGGTPPRTRFLDDHGGGSGCTLYVGQKGHKQLCIYDKGKQLGSPDSPWVRYEVRFYGKHAVIPLDILVDSFRYLRGSYGYLDSLLSRVVSSVSSRIHCVVKHVEASGVAMVRWLRRQAGPAISLLRQSLGESFNDFIAQYIERSGFPSRFRRMCSRVQLPTYFRESLAMHPGFSEVSNVAA